ncbi:MAG: hypothetical protein GWP17_06515 [Aquificales bacterium]|nr:hypothetical protein [Aquificales bacterium]
MNEQFSHYDFSGDQANMAINSTLVTMQIQALRESLRRLVDQDDGTEVELLDNELTEVQTRPNC